MRRLTLCFAALALVVAGCGDDDSAGTATSSTDGAVTTALESSTTSTPPSSSTTAAEAGLTGSCTSPDGFTISYPADWDVVSDCGQFGPAPIDEPAPATDERTGVVSAYVDAVPFEQVAEPADGDGERTTATVAGRPAVRVEAVTTGAGLYPAGIESVRWLVDLSGDGAGPRTLFVDAYDLFDDVDFPDAVEVLDAMVETIEVETAAG